MVCLSLILLGSFLSSACASSAVLQDSRALNKEHPIAGVLSLLDDLQVKAKEEGKAEEENYSKYVAWCTESKGTLNTAIANEKAEISSLTSKIASLKDGIDTLTADISYLGTQIEEQNSAAAKAKGIREEENDLYKEEQTNIDSTIDAVKQATDAMEGTKFLQEGAKKKIRTAALLTEYRMTPEQHQKVKSFLHSAAFLQQNGPEDPPENDYDFKSGGIIATFKSMIEDFEVEKDQSTTEETNTKNNYNLAKKAREDAIKAAEDAKEEKETAKSDKESAKSDAESSKSEEEAALVADTALLEKTTKDCATTASEWEERSKIRSDEIMAMEMAKKILSKVSKVRNPDEHEIAKKSLLQVPSFFQAGLLRGHRGVDKKVQAIQELQKIANNSHAVHAKALSQLAMQLMTYDGPFDKLKSMIQKMIFRLMAEQKDEDDHKNWCDLEMETSTESKEDKDSKMKQFTKKLEQMSKKVIKLTEDITENDDRIEELTTTMKEETALREENHKSNQITIKDAKDAQVALNNAISVLTTFYKESGMIAKEPWEFIQLDSRAEHKAVQTHKLSTRDVDLPDNPATWDSSYTGTTDPKNGDQAVLALLEETNDKFAAMEADATVADTTDQENYEADMQAMKIEMAEVKTDTSMKTQKKSSLEGKVEGMTAAKKHTAREMSAVEAYLTDLEPACGEGDSSYEDRKKARKDEMEALRKAQNIFEDAFRAKE